MKTGRTICWIAAAAALVCVACSQPEDFGRDRQGLDDAPGNGDAWPVIPEDQVADLPACGGSELPRGRIVVYIVIGGEGLLALSIDDELMCVDDAAGLIEIGVPEQLIPDDCDYMNSPDIPGDGTPLPAGPNQGVSDGTPLPA